MEKKPWEIYSALTAERLCTIGAILGNVRRKALDVYDPDEGDGPWNSECTVYQRTLNILKRYSNQYPWFVIRNIGLYFVMIIDGVPIRYYRGDFEKPHLRSLKIKQDEQGFHEQLSLLDTGNSGWYMRMVVETDMERQVANIGIMQFHEYTEDRRNLWVLPNDMISQISLASHKPKIAVIQPRALASIKKDITQEGTEHEEKR